MGQLFEDVANFSTTRQHRQREMNLADFDDNRERYERPLKEARDAIADYLDNHRLWPAEVCS
jgi:hypothetical protein